MSKKHEAVFDDVLKGMDSRKAEDETQDARGSRFLKRTTGLAERIGGDREEKTLLWVDPAECRMWARHNRSYDLLNENNCADLIDGIRAQGRQEFPAVVRRLKGEDHRFEVVCGARRHFAVSWLRDHNYPQFKYLVDVRDLTDEEAFRLSDIENRDREDISDYERACDYARAVDLYYGGRQKDMAERLEVGTVWLSRYLKLATLPQEVVAAFASIRDLKEIYARKLRPGLEDKTRRGEILAEARIIAKEQARARKGQGGYVEPGRVVQRLLAGGKKTAEKPPVRIFRRAPEESGVSARKSGRKTVLEVPDSLSKTAVEYALAEFIKARFGD